MTEGGVIIETASRYNPRSRRGSINEEYDDGYTSSYDYNRYGRGQSRYGYDTDLDARSTGPSMQRGNEPTATDMGYNPEYYPEVEGTKYSRRPPPRRNTSSNRTGYSTGYATTGYARGNNDIDQRDYDYFDRYRFGDRYGDRYSDRYSDRYGNNQFDRPVSRYIDNEYIGKFSNYGGQYDQYSPRGYYEPQTETTGRYGQPSTGSYRRQRYGQPSTSNIGTTGTTGSTNAPLPESAGYNGNTSNNRYGNYYDNPNDNRGLHYDEY